MYTTILFDLDGTLVDSADDIAASVRALQRRRGLEEASDAAVKAAIGDGVRVLLERTLPSVDEAALAEYLEHQEAHCLDRTHLYPGVKEALPQLAARAGLAVVSNKPTFLCVKILEGLGVLAHFRAVVGGDTPAGRKPSPGPCLRALASLERPPWDALVVGDAPGDIASGRAAGCAVAGAGWGYRAPAELRSAGATRIFDGFGSLASHLTDLPRTVYEAVGRERFFELARAFYRRVGRDGRLRSMFPADLGPAAERQALFLIQFFGGPSEYAALRGAPRLRMRHAAFPIDAAARDAWLENMRAALDDVRLEGDARGIAERYFEHTAQILVNRT